MVKVSNVSPITGLPVPSHYLHTSDIFFRDTKGRAVLLRGVNLSGTSKAPIDQPSHVLQDFWDSAENGGRSFVGQPLNLQDGSADIHLSRLRSWGFNCLRYVFTWEAIEHRGPRQYDQGYLEYTVQVLRKVKEYGFKVFMDPHQDLFSRFTGGSGAPYWTIIACGINPRKLSKSKSAFLHCEWPDSKNPQPDQFPPMIWATNYTRLAAATLFALFFAGKHFAPRCIIDGQNVQDWLQDHFIAACQQLASPIQKAGDLADDCVIGWDSINEPNKTFLGLSSLSYIPKEWQLKAGPMPTPIQSFRLGIGMKQVIENWTFGSLGPKRAGSVTIDPQGTSIWLTEKEDETLGSARWGWRRDPAWPLGQCIWAAHGAWDQNTGQILNDRYFSFFGGPAGDRPLDFVDEYWLPHWRAYAKAIRTLHPEAIMFIQPPVFEPPPRSLNEKDLQQRACVSPHFYDGLTLITKHWNWFNADAVGLLRGKYPSVLFALRLGNKAIRQAMRDQLGYLCSDTLEVLGKYPTMIGEIGIPYDLDGRKSYYGDSKGNGIDDYSSQTLAMDASLNGCDGSNMLNYTIWTYCPDNTHEWGDGWNGEDLSIWSLDDMKKKQIASSIYKSNAQSEVEVDTLLLYNDPKDGSSTQRIPGSSIRAASVPESAHVAFSPTQPSSMLEGTRAAAAFCRPFPTASVGYPVEINFDIKTSEFTFCVDVTKEDVGDESIPTEIYVPFIHYASDASFNKCNAHLGLPNISSDQQRRASVLGPCSSSSFTSSVQSLNQFQNNGSDSSCTNVPPLISIDVVVSAGRWETEGQYLRWYMTEADIPSSKVFGNDSNAYRHTIKIKRKGDSIQTLLSGGYPNLFASCGLF